MQTTRRQIFKMQLLPAIKMFIYIFNAFFVFLNMMRLTPGSLFAMLLLCCSRLYVTCDSSTTWCSTSWFTLWHHGKCVLLVERCGAV